MRLARLIAHPDNNRLTAEGGLAEAFTRGIKTVHIDVEDDLRFVVALGVGERVEGHGNHQCWCRYPPDSILLICDVSVKILTPRQLPMSISYDPVDIFASVALHGGKPHPSALSETALSGSTLSWGSEGPVYLP
jgi:hypothetical protein